MPTIDWVECSTSASQDSTSSYSKGDGMREIIKWTLALTLGAFGALLSLAIALFSFVVQLVMGLLMIMGVVAVGAKGVIDDMDKKAGSVFDKEKSPEHNRRVVEVLHAEFEKEFAMDSKAFRTVGPSSPDPELREIYAMLPQSTKDAIKDVWGSDSMLVHVGTLRTAFGCRKLS